MAVMSYVDAVNDALQRLDDLGYERGEHVDFANHGDGRRDPSRPKTAPGTPIANNLMTVPRTRARHRPRS